MSGTQNGGKLATFAVGVATAGGIVIAIVTLIPDHSLRYAAVDSTLRQILALSLMSSGLFALFPLAAFGPKTDQQKASRLSRASIGVVQVVLALAQVAPSLAVRGALTTVSGLLALAMLLKVHSKVIAGPRELPNPRR